jgi:threonylcarbamoyladenosine tRNA methylthiotransferase MtaB
VSLVERLPFTYLHVFPYSPRQGTASLRLSDHVAPALAQERAAELREMAAQKSAAYAASRAGGLADVVVIGAVGEREGLTGDYLTVLPSDPMLPRGARFVARLSSKESTLIATPVPK